MSAAFLAVAASKDVVLSIGSEYAEVAGREYGLIEPYRMDDAEVAIVALSTGAGTARVAADFAREKGIKAGVLRVRCFRPFPADKIVAQLAGKKVVAVFDRTHSATGTVKHFRRHQLLFPRRVRSGPHKGKSCGDL